jgi:hypothetical protein
MLVQDLPHRLNNNLARMYFSFWDFDENFYLETYADLVASIPSQHFSNAFHHFCTVGYREGRLPAEPQVDEQWYINQYSDVAHAVVMGDVDDAAAHYKEFGYAEGRLPAAPDIDVKWYSQTYLGFGAQETHSFDECLEHFMKHGYRSGALPSFPREIA